MSLSDHINDDDSTAKLQTIRLLQSILANKPIDGSDIQTLDDATYELKRIRQLMEQYHAAHVPSSSSAKIEPATTTNQQQQVQTTTTTTPQRKRRNAIHEEQHIKTYIKTTIPKDPPTQQLIYNAIKTNLLFQENTIEELYQLVDIFEPCHYNRGGVVIQQGDMEDDSFYVVECGELSIYVAMGDTNNTTAGQQQQQQQQQHKVGTFGSGSAFGELALIYSSPRAATIISDVDNCKLWKIQRSWYRGVIGQYRQQIYQQISIKFLPKVNVPRNKTNNYFKDIFSPVQLDMLTGVVKQISFQAGEYIIREQEKGDTFYMIQKGEVDILLKSLGYDKPIVSLGSGKYFGEKALLVDDVREATVRAKTNVSCFILTREDVNRVIGSLVEILEYGFPTKMPRTSTVVRGSSEKEQVPCDITDLELLGVLGSGAFGKVRVAKAEKTGKYYALKMQSKSFIIQNEQQDDVMHEYSILKQLDHPFILHLHCAMQDEKYIYFLTDIHHELMQIMDQKEGGCFSEECTRFYSACVLLAFQAMHSSSIAYRDLKPENLVLDDHGYCILVDLGLAKKCDGHLYTFCGTPDYLAPEVIRGTGYNWGVDYWGLGVLLYELFTGRAPFDSYDPTGTAKKILKGVVNFPDKVTGPMKDLIKALLTKDQTRRLGVLKGGTEDVMKHRFYTGFDWGGLLNMQKRAPFEPQPVNDYEALGTPDSGEDDATPVTNWNPDFGS